MDIIDPNKIPSQVAELVLEPQWEFGVLSCKYLVLLFTLILSRFYILQSIEIREGSPFQKLTPVTAGRGVPAATGC